MTLPLDDLDLLATPGDLLAGAPLQLRIDSIDEDPDQPRREFDPERLVELAQTIKARGVRQAVSVRRHPAQPDRWMLNFGARRLRASKLAGKDEIPAFVDNAADSYDQVIENEQREGLKPLELALFVQRRLATGESQADIARHLGKSRAFVTFATALIDAPQWMLAAYREGRCRGLRELYELRQAHERLGVEVESWAATQPTITRSELAALRVSKSAGDGVEAAGQGAKPEGRTQRADSAPAALGPTASGQGALPADKSKAAPAAAAPMPRLIVQAEVEGQAVEVLLDRMPADASQVFVRNGDQSPARQVSIATVTLRRLLRR